MDRLSALSEKILSLLIFEEEYDNILSDVKGEKSSHIGDELKMLIVKDFVRPCREIGSGRKSGFIYDSDKLEHYSFTLTGKGLSYLEALSKTK